MSLKVVHQSLRRMWLSYTILKCACAHTAAYMRVCNVCRKRHWMLSCLFWYHYSDPVKSWQCITQNSCCHWQVLIWKKKFERVIYIKWSAILVCGFGVLPISADPDRRTINRSISRWDTKIQMIDLQKYTHKHWYMDHSYTYIYTQRLVCAYTLTHKYNIHPPPNTHTHTHTHTQGFT